jgi:hypothetical protein
MKLLGLDTETCLRNGVHKFISFQIYSEDFDVKRLSYGRDELKDFFSSKFRNSMYLAQNMEFDTAIIRQLLDDKEFQFRLLYSGSRLIATKIARGKNNFTLADTKNLFGGLSLKKIGEVIKCPKFEQPKGLGVTDFSKVPHDVYFEKYAMRDAEICFKAGEFIKKRMGTMAITLPSLAMKTYRKNYQQGGVFVNIADEINADILKAYKGGRVECFKRGSPAGTLFAYDVNSLYPFVMARCKYPYFICQPQKVSAVNLCYEGIAHALIKSDSDVPPLCIKKMCADGFKKLIFPEGKFKGWFTYPELRYLEQHNLGKILKVKEAYEVRQTGRPFRKFVETFYQHKKACDKRGSAERSFWKLFLVSLYGKFAQHKIGDLLSLGQNGVVEKLPQRKKIMFSTNYMLAAYITAYARLYLHSRMRRTGFENLVYCDTDSIVSDKELNFTGDGLGDFQLITQSDGEGRATFVRSKFYIFNDVIKCRGFMSLSSAKEMRDMIEKDKVEQTINSLLRIRSAFRRHKQMLSAVGMLKHFRIDDDKKRIYSKKLNGLKLLTDFSKSAPLKLGGVHAV